jgi:hypothetical protein
MDQCYITLIISKHYKCEHQCIDCRLHYATHIRFCSSLSGENSYYRINSHDTYRLIYGKPYSTSKPGPSGPRQW